MAAQNGSSIFPLVMPTSVIAPEFLTDAYVQLLELIASQCAASSGASFSGVTTFSGNITESSVGSGFVQKASATGAGRAGTFTLNGATNVTVTNTTVATSDFIGLSLNTVGGTVGAQPHIVSIQAGTSFVVVGTAGDTSTYNYSMIGVN